MTKKKFLIELVIVVLGVTIAFTLNSIKDSYKLNKQKRIAIQNITQELNDNNESLRQLISKQDSMLSAYNDTADIENSVFTFHTISIRTGVYRSIESSGLLGELNSEELIDILNIYEGYSTILDLEKYLMQDVYTLSKTNSPKESLENAYFWIEQLNNNEKMLLEEGEELAAKIKD